MVKQSYLGRGLEPIAGKPFGWAHNQERAEIEEHLLNRGWSRSDLGFYSRVVQIQMRLNREHPKRWAAKIAAIRAARPAPAPTREPFTDEELALIAQHFAGANDPVAQSIYAKAVFREDRNVT